MGYVAWGLTETNESRGPCNTTRCDLFFFFNYYYLFKLLEHSIVGNKNKERSEKLDFNFKFTNGNGITMSEEVLSNKTPEKTSKT